ncbi:uncharacterized protein UTRI_06219 [Ustilago trichophora]|uniref:Effector family protein Eff1 n=1 Tax=Ustilago trichophora TaxID=86804 RepID=A0A5C3EG80_9BASI|nr:uncharacterized protein UTRI_06219 [Ustilago trichophora]
MILSFLTQVLLYSLACFASDVPRRPEVPQNAAAPQIVFVQHGYYLPSPSAYPPGAPAPPAVIGMPVAYVPPAAAHRPVPPLPPAAIHRPVPHLPPDTGRGGVPTRNFPSLTSTPIPRRGSHIKAVREVFYNGLVSTLSPRPVSFVSYLEPRQHSYAQIDDLREQLERNKRNPILKLNGNPFNPNPEARLYAYLVEATPAMEAAFGRFYPDRLRWAILEVYAGPRPHINIITYFETSRLRLNQIQGPFWLNVGSRTYPLEDVIRRIP